VISLSPAQASPAGRLQIARGHWVIENGGHYVRDVTMREDASQLRKGLHLR
jgi:predicted transposase YbfD/YdcC